MDIYEWYEITSLPDFELFKKRLEKEYGKGFQIKLTSPERFPCIIKYDVQYNNDYWDEIVIMDTVYANENGIYEIIPVRNW